MAIQERDIESQENQAIPIAPITPAPHHPTREIPELEYATSLDKGEAQLQAIIEIGHTLCSTNDPEKILTLLLEKITELLEADRSSLYLVDYQKGEVWSKILQGEDDVSIRLPLGEGIVGWVAQSGETINIPDVYNEPRFNPDVDRASGYQTRNLLTMPLKNRQGEIIGVIQILNKNNGRVFSEADEDILQSISSQAAIFLENARLYQALWKKHVELMQTTRQLKRRTEELNIVYDIEQELNSSFDLDEILSNILRRVVVLLGCEAATLAHIKGEQSRLFIHSPSPENKNRVLIVPTAIQPGEGFMGCALQSGDAILSNDASRDGRLTQGLPGRLMVPLRSILCVPFKVQDECKGAIELINKDKGTGFNQNDLRLMTQIAAQISRVIEMAERREEEVKENRLATIGQLISGVLHDLKGPMTIISGYTEMMTAQSDEAKREKFGQAILKQIEQLNRMTREVMAFARGDSTLFVRKVNLHNFFLEIKENLEQEFSGTSIDLNIVKNYSGYASFDEIKIQRLIFNLARNARQAMADDGLFEVTIAKKKEQLLLRFRDTGPGIPPELQTRVFESFVTGHPSKGNGLGLAIVKKIVEDHGGSITFSSTPKGTTFFVQLPTTQESSSLSV